MMVYFGANFFAIFRIVKKRSIILFPVVSSPITAATETSSLLTSKSHPGSHAHTSGYESTPLFSLETLPEYFNSTDIS